MTVYYISEIAGGQIKPLMLFWKSNIFITKNQWIENILFLLSELIVVNNLKLDLVCCKIMHVNLCKYFVNCFNFRFCVCLN